MKAPYRWMAVSCAFVVVAACGGGGGDGGGGPSGGAGMSARINGTSWTANQVQATVGGPAVPGSVVILGIKVSGTSTSSISLILGFISGPGTYPLGVNQGTSAGGTGIYLTTSPSATENRTTPLNGNSGTLVVTSLTADHLVGTFEFVAQPILGSTFTGNRNITQGTLDIDLPSPLSTVPAGNHGSKVSANLGGTVFNAATVVGLGSAGSFSFGGGNDSLDLSFVTSTPITIVGDYGFVTGFHITVSDLKLNHNWGGGIAGDSGIVAVSSVANGRIVGTFSGRLHALGGAQPDIMVTGGSFDVRINASP